MDDRRLVLPDHHRFRYLSPEPIPKEIIPPGTTMRLEMLTTRELIARRRAKLANG